MVLRRIGTDPIDVIGYGVIAKDETVKVNDRTGELLLAQDGWEEAEAKATRKRSAVERGK